MRSFYIIALAVLCVPAYAQKYEFGVHGGLSMYSTKTVTSPRGTADAGFKQGFGAGVTLGNDMYRYLGGEIRYTYLRNDMKVSSGGTEATFGAEAHAVSYDFLLHAAPRESRVRPYAAFGGGVKYFRGTGKEAAFQPLTNYAILTRTNDIKGLVSVGGGIKFAISQSMLFRIDVHDYLTTVPTKVLTPGPGASLKGWMHNLVPTAGISWTF